MISRPATASPGSKTPAIVDTGFLIAFAREEDEYHEWALEVARKLQLPLLTCEAVLADTSFLLQSSAYVLAMMRRDVLRVALDCSNHVEQLLDLRGVVGRLGGVLCVGRRGEHHENEGNGANSHARKRYLPLAVL